MVGVPYYSVLDTSTSSGTHTYTHAHTYTHTILRPEGWLSLIETNGEITQAAVLNNSLHSHLSGSTVRKWESGLGCWDQWSRVPTVAGGYSGEGGGWDAEDVVEHLKNQVFPFLRLYIFLYFHIYINLHSPKTNLE